MKKNLQKGLLVFVISLMVMAFSSPKRVEVEEKINWLTLEEAYAQNLKEPRKIFVDVYTDWCGWCKRMDKETFANAGVAAYVNKNYYAVKLNAESDRSFELEGQKMTERQVAKQFGVRSFPTIVLIHEDFQKFQPVPGYRPAKDFKEMLENFKAININAKGN
jgi:thioredoxin-related protein